MATTENEVERIHIAITYVKSLHLPDILKPGFRGTLRRLYAVVSIGDSRYEMSSLDSEAYATRPMTFLSKPSAKLSIELFAKRSRHDDILLAQAQVQVNRFGDDEYSEVSLVPTMDSELESIPILVLKISTSDRFTDDANLKSLRTSLEINPRVTRAFGNISLLVKIGSAISGLNPIAKAVMGIIEIANSKFEEILKRNESVLQLVEAVGDASVLVADWDNPELADHRPHQQQVCRELLPEIYRCLHLLWTLSDEKLGKQLSKKSEEAVQAHLSPLLSLVKRMESNTQLDTQEIIFNISDKVTYLHDRACIERLHYAKGVSPSKLKVCLPGTRVALLEQIQDWALNPTGERLLLLYGAAGKGKSTIIHTVAIALESLGIAVPFFAFNRSAKDRSLSQLIPTWAKKLAESNAQYLHYLSTLPEPLESLDILDLVVKGLASFDNMMPLIFTIDALDECPADETDTLFRMLQELLSISELPRSVRFLFTFRPDKSITSPFSDFPTLSLSIDNIDGTSTDIHAFVKNQLLRTDFEYMINDVAESSQTLFQCAAVLCRELKSVRGPKLMSVRRGLLQKVREAPGRPLYASYHAILKLHFDEGNAELMQLFRRVMSWIFLVQSPQPRQVIQAFAGVLLSDDEQLDVNEILPYLGSLLSGTMPGDSSPITPLHTSLRDFLLDATESHSFYIDLSHGLQEEIAWACLRIMNTGLEFNICKLPTSFALNSQIMDLSQRVKNYISPELQYACLASAQHLQKTILPSTTHYDQGTLSAPSQCIQLEALDIADELNLFLHHKFLYWLEAHSCMQTQRDGPGTMLPLFLKWAMSVGDNALKILLLDYIKFEKRFREGYMLSAPQIYYSGLAFAPRDSLVPQLYSSLFHNLITVSEDIDIVWPPSEPLVIHETYPVHAIAFSPNGAHIASGGVDTSIKLWDVVTGQQVGEALRYDEGLVNSVAFSPDGTHFVVGSNDKSIMVWDLVMRKQPGKALRGHEDSVMSTAFSPDGTHIVSGSKDKTIRMWDTVTGKQVGETLRGHKDTVNSVAYSPNGTHIASGSDDKTIRLWDAITGKQVGKALRGHGHGVSSVTFSPDGTYILSGSDDRTVRMWNVMIRQQIGKALRGHEGFVQSVGFLPDGTHIVSGSYDNTIKVWNVVTRQQIGETLRGHEDCVNSVVFSPDGTHIGSGSDDKTIRVWDVAVIEQQVGETLRPRGHEDRVDSVAFSPDGRHIVSGSYDKTIRIWDSVTGQQVGGNLQHEIIFSVTFSPDGTYIASGSYDNTIRVWDAVTGKQVGEALRGHEGGVCSVAYSPDGTYIVSGSHDRTIRIWDAVRRQQIGEALRGHKTQIDSVAFSPDGRHIVSGSNDKTIRVWNAVSRQQIGEALTEHDHSVCSVAFSSDSTHIVSAHVSALSGFFEHIRLWNLATGEQVYKALRDNTKRLALTAAFSPDGTHIVLGTSSRLSIWDTTGQQISEAVNWHKSSLTSVAFSPDGTCIVSASADGTIRVWNLMMMLNTYPTCPQLCNNWFSFRKELTESYILWIPPFLRSRYFTISPFDIVITDCPKINVQFEGASLGPDWAKIKK